MRQADIQEEGIGEVGAGGFQGISALVDGFGVESGQFQEHRQGLCEIAMIIRDEDEWPPPEDVNWRSNIN